MEIKKIFTILLLGVLSLFGCVHNKSLHEKINTLIGIDYSEFKDMSIVNRKGVYFVTYHGITYKIKRGAKKISSIEVAYSKDKKVLLAEKDIDNIEKVLKYFDKIDVLSLSVDKNGNVLLTLPWHDRCTYYLLKLSSKNTLEDLKKQYYHNYKENWYMYKECSERG